ncbi:hypothetical protein K8R30_00425 [archaeon]|nr:hypothetical protein [archaeon]
MKKLFRKAMNVAGSVALVGLTVGVAAAASYPDPFTSDTAIVVGAGAAPSDNIAAASIAANLDAESAGTSTTTLTDAEGVTEEEVVLGGQIDATGYKVESTMTDSKIPSLLDEKISWDDGDGSDDYDIHEEIIIGDMSLITSLDDEDLDGVALTNNKAFEYRYIFDDALNVSLIGTDDADTLYMTILGKQYEIDDMTATTIKVVTSDEVALSIGESVTADGKVFTVDDVFDGKAQINGEIISEGATEKIDGVQVRLDTVGYHSNAPELSKVIIRIGEDITKTYSSGDEYIGEDEDDPLWIWNIVDADQADGYVGVKYNANINDADDDEAGDSIKYEGAGYIMPTSFAEVRLDSLTDADYEDVTVKFAQEDLFNSTYGTANLEDEYVVVITAETTSSITVGSEETDEIYIWFAANNSETEGAAVPSVTGSIEVFYRDHDGDATPTGRARFELNKTMTSAGALTRVNVATIEIGDTVMDVDVSATGGYATVHFENPSDSDIDLAIGGTQITATAGTLERLGAVAEDADADDIKVNGTDVSTKEESIMDYYGIIVADEDAGGVEGNADEDEVTLSIPDEQVFAEVSVVAGGQASTSGDAGVMTVKDADVATVAGKNLVVIGGSAINSVAAELLGGAYREALFTSATGVAAGEFLIESFSRAGQTALLVAGYNAADTEKAVTYLLNNDVDTTVGTKMKGTSATEATVVTA